MNDDEDDNDTGSGHVSAPGDVSEEEEPRSWGVHGAHRKHVKGSSNHVVTRGGTGAGGGEQEMQRQSSQPNTNAIFTLDDLEQEERAVEKEFGYNAQD